MKSKPLYRIGDRTGPVKLWAEIWGVSYASAYQRLTTMLGKRVAELVR